jgi:hypothetical protein
VGCCSPSRIARISFLSFIRVLFAVLALVPFLFVFLGVVFLLEAFGFATAFLAALLALASFFCCKNCLVRSDGEGCLLCESLLGVSTLSTGTTASGVMLNFLGVGTFGGLTISSVSRRDIANLSWESSDTLLTVASEPFHRNLFDGGV